MSGLGVYVKARTVLVMAGFAGAFGLGLFVGTWTLAKTVDATYVLQEDLDLSTTYALGGQSPVSGTLRAGSEFTVVKGYGYHRYVDIRTVLTSTRIEEIAKPVPERP